MLDSSLAVLAARGDANAQKALEAEADAILRKGRYATDGRLFFHHRQQPDEVAAGLMIVKDDDQGTEILLEIGEEDDNQGAEGDCYRISQPFAKAAGLALAM